MPSSASGMRGTRVQAQDAHGTVIALQAQFAAGCAILAPHTEATITSR